MAAAANIVLADHVPANHTFLPIDIKASLSLYETSEASIGAAEKQLLLGIDRASSKRATDRVAVRLNVPFEQTVEGTVSVRDTARFIGEWILPASMTPTERSLFQKLAQNAVAHAVAALLITNREAPW